MNNQQDMNSNLLELENVLKQVTSHSLGRRAFLASLPVLFAACAAPRHREREGNVQNEKISMTPDDERKMTQEVLPQMKKEYPAIDDPKLQSYISNLGQRIVQSNNLVNNPYQYNFTVVGVDYVNAFALPAGTVFVTAPLLAMAESEAELAGVVGHEIGHVKSRHTAQRIDAANRENSKSWLFGAGGGILGGAAGFGLGKLLCSKQDKMCLAKATALGAAAGVGGGLLIQKFAFMANSREDEMEADRIGFKTSVATGYSKEHVGLFYSKLLKMEEAHQKNNTPVLSSMADALSTHPPSRERVVQMQEMAASTSQLVGKVSSKEFEEVKKLAQSWVDFHKKS